MTDYKPQWSGIVKPHDFNEVYEGGLMRLSEKDRMEIEMAQNRLLEIKNLGERGASEVLAKLGMFLNGQTKEFIRLTIEGQKALKGDSK